MAKYLLPEKSHTKCGGETGHSEAAEAAPGQHVPVSAEASLEGPVPLGWWGHFPLVGIPVTRDEPCASPSMLTHSQASSPGHSRALGTWLLVCQAAQSTQDRGILIAGGTQKTPKSSSSFLCLLFTLSWPPLYIQAHQLLSDSCQK